MAIGRLTGSTLRGAIAAVCGTAFLVSFNRLLLCLFMFMPLSSSLFALREILIINLAGDPLVSEKSHNS